MDKASKSQSTTSLLSLAVITLNEEENLGRCLESAAGLADEIVIVDSGSTDKTKVIAEKYHAVFEYHPWPGHVAQKNRALEKCTHQWVLSLDADECLSPELKEEIQKRFTDGSIDQWDGYLLNRKTFYLGDWIHYAWYPEWRLRLVNRELAQWEGTDPHDHLRVKGKVHKLKGGDFHHFSYRNLQHHMEVSLQYARIGAEADIRNGNTFRAHKLFTSPLGRLFKFVFLKRGWMDGWRGWIILGSAMMTAFVKQAHLLEHKLKNRDEYK